MPNPHRCEAEFVARSERFQLRWDWNAACEFEAATGRHISDALADVATGRLSAISLRGLLWAGLRAHHPQLSITDAGELIPVIGRAEAMRLVGTGLRYFYPELEAEPPPADPQTPAPSA